MYSPNERFRAKRRGVTAAEVALVMVPLFTMIIATFEYCRYMMIRNLAENACREGVRYAVVNTYDKATSDVQNAVQQKLAGLTSNLENMVVSVYKVNVSNGSTAGDWTDAKFGEAIAVKIQGNYRPVTPNLLFMPTTFPINCTATMLSEAN